MGFSSFLDILNQYRNASAAAAPQNVEHSWALWGRARSSRVA